MKEEPDEYCEKIIKTLIINEITDKPKVRFNKLLEILPKYGAKMSKPTLVQHLNHLVKNKIIQRNKEGKQKISYRINWSKFLQPQNATEINLMVSQMINHEKIFKSKSLNQQIELATTAITIGELFYLGLNVLDILEPQNKLQNYYQYTFIRGVFNHYVQWLIDSCYKSKEDSQKALDILSKNIKTLRKTLFEENPEDTQQKPENTTKTLQKS
jgi:predicted transcriptional regulator